MRKRGRPDTKENKKGLWNALAFVLILSATLFGVLRGQDMGELKNALAQCRTDWIVCAAGCVLLFIACEGLNLWILLRSYGMNPGGPTCFLVSCVGFFFSSVTPSASGGQPAQVYFLRKKGLPVSVSSATLMLLTIANKGVLTLTGLCLRIFAGSMLRECFGEMIFLFYIGVALNAGWAALLTMLLFRPGMARSIIVWGMTVLEELHILKNREKRQTALEVSMASYAETADFIRKHKHLSLGAAAVTIVRRTLLFSITWCMYKALGLSGTGWFTVVLMQAAVSISADMLPLPGGMGVSEALFLKVFGGVFGGMVLPGMILSRGIGHYAQLIFSGLFTMIAAVSVRRGRRII